MFGLRQMLRSYIAAGKARSASYSDLSSTGDADSLIALVYSSSLHDFLW